MKRLWLCVVVCACGAPKLTSKVEEQARSSNGPARFEDVADLKPGIEVSGIPEGEYSAAVKKQLSPEAGKVTVSLDKAPENRKGTFDTIVTVEAKWWHLPQLVTAHGDLHITLDYNRQSPAQLGKAVGDLVEAFIAKSRPKVAAVPAPVTSPATSVALGTQIGCSLHKDQSVHCWTSQPSELVGYVPTKAFDGALEIAAGESAVCARLGNEVRCVDRPSGDERGIVVTKPCGITQAFAIAMGGHRGCAIVGDGRVRCWDTDKLGYSSAECQPTDTAHETYEIAGLTGATQIALGSSGGCALVAGGKTTCWEHDARTATPTKLPTATQVLYGFRACVLEASGQITCEHGPHDADLLLETKVPPGSKVMLQGTYGCAVEPDGKLECWGENGDGAIGDGTTTSSKVTRPIADGVVAASISIFGGCAVTKDGALLCHGKPNPLAAEAETPAKVTIF